MFVGEGSYHFPVSIPQSGQGEFRLSAFELEKELADMFQSLNRDKGSLDARIACRNSRKMRFQSLNRDKGSLDRG